MLVSLCAHVNTHTVLSQIQQDYLDVIHPGDEPRERKQRINWETTAQRKWIKKIKDTVDY